MFYSDLGWFGKRAVSEVRDEAYSQFVLYTDRCLYIWVIMIHRT